MLPLARPVAPDPVAEIAAELMDAAWDPSLWPAVLSRLCREVGCDRALLVRAQGKRRVVLATSDLDPAAVRGLAGRRLAPAADRGITVPEEHCEISLAATEGDLRLMIDRREIEPARAAVLPAIAPLVARAWRLTDALASNRRQRSWTAAQLEGLATGILVLSTSGRVLESNDAAQRMLAEPTDVSIASGVLRASSESLQRALGELLSRAARVERRGAVTASLLLPRASGPLELLIVGSSRFADGNPEAVAIAMAFEPGKTDEDPAQVLGGRYRLCFEETQVVSLLLHGYDIPGVAAELKVKRAAVEACLRSLYEQMGTSRQVELVKVLLARGPQPV